MLPTDPMEFRLVTDDPGAFSFSQATTPGFPYLSAVRLTAETVRLHNLAERSQNGLTTETVLCLGRTTSDGRSRLFQPANTKISLIVPIGLRVFQSMGDAFGLRRLETDRPVRRRSMVDPPTHRPTGDRPTHRPAGDRPTHRPTVAWVGRQMYPPAPARDLLVLPSVTGSSGGTGDSPETTTAAVGGSAQPTRPVLTVHRIAPGARQRSARVVRVLPTADGRPRLRTGPAPSDRPVRALPRPAIVHRTDSSAPTLTAQPPRGPPPVTARRPQLSRRRPATQPITRSTFRDRKSPNVFDLTLGDPDYFDQRRWRKWISPSGTTHIDRIGKPVVRHDGAYGREARLAAREKARVRAAGVRSVWLAARPTRVPTGRR